MEHRHLNKEARYNHAVSMSFTVENNSAEGELTNDEIMHAIMRRLLLLMENPCEFREVCEVYDTFDNEEN